MPSTAFPSAANPPLGGPALALVGALAAIAVLACRAPQRDPAQVLEETAPAYVRLVLALGELDPGYVDAYYGPAEWKEEAAREAAPLAELGRRTEELLDALERARPEGDDVELSQRHRYLVAQLAALAARVRFLQGERLPFDDESKAFFDAVAPHRDEASFAPALAALDRALADAGVHEGSLSERYEAFRHELVIPPERLDAVFQAAIAACRERTAAHLELPPGESFRVEYVTAQPWSAYNWYKGDYHSLIQVNTDLPIYIDRAVDLACHEGYPGHHVLNALREQHLVRERRWIEHSVYPLHTPVSLIAEGSANFGIEMAFPGDQRLTFERDVLFPAAGLDPARAAAYHAVVSLTDRLGHAGIEAARRYLDGAMSAEATVDWLTRFTAVSPARAQQQRRFFDGYRSYILNYHLGRELVRDWVAREAGDDVEARWRAFGLLLSTPRVPSDLGR